MYRKTPPPLTNRHQSAPEIDEAATHEDDMSGFCARLNGFITDAASRPRRVFRKTLLPPPMLRPLPAG